MSEEKRVADWYDALSPSYNELYGEEQARKHKVIMEHIGHEKFEILVDIGCGPGTLLKELHESYDFAVGVDLSKDMLGAAKNRRSSKTDLVVATSGMLPFKDGTIDCIVSISTIKADSNLPQILSEIRRISRRHGVLALSLFHQSEDMIPALPFRPRWSSRISARETVYYLRLD